MVESSTTNKHANNIRSYQTNCFSSDHAGFEYKEAIKKWLIGRGLQVKDFATYSPDSVDYADFAHHVSFFVENGPGHHERRIDKIVQPFRPFKAESL